MSVFGVILVGIFPYMDEYGEILRISPYSVRMRENADQNNSEFGHFPAVVACNVWYRINAFLKGVLICWKIAIKMIIAVYWTNTRRRVNIGCRLFVNTRMYCSLPKVVCKKIFLKISLNSSPPVAASEQSYVMFYNKK